MPERSTRPWRRNRPGPNRFPQYGSTRPHPYWRPHACCGASWVRTVRAPSAPRSSRARWSHRMPPVPGLRRRSPASRCAVPHSVRWSPDARPDGEASERGSTLRAMNPRRAPAWLRLRMCRPGSCWTPGLFGRASFGRLDPASCPAALPARPAWPLRRLHVPIDCGEAPGANGVPVEQVARPRPRPRRYLPASSCRCRQFPDLPDALPRASARRPRRASRG
jgi:hypothetical protein